MRNGYSPMLKSRFRHQWNTKKGTTRNAGRAFEILAKGLFDVQPSTFSPMLRAVPSIILTA
ncbi:hypothetical protein Pla52n_36310 [Stieleria varia]|uniref:Uncharacterized protein n=1 Tax=Stieleria varia TaxID=2528005 RepID=A0A5C6AT45_9BACT|nr:hypothetical protein Pla52n_36310 [Stieleria varia]